MGKKIALGVAVLLLIGIGVAIYFWRQATALPQWYADDPDAFEHADTQGEAPAEWIAVDEDGQELEAQWPDAPPAAKSPASEHSPAEAEAPKGKSEPKSKTKKRRARRHEMRGFHRRGGKKNKGAVRASRAFLEDGKLEAGVILDLSRLPKNELTARDRKLFDRAVEGFPGLTKRNIYVGLEDRPVTHDGLLQLGDSPKVRVGNLRYSLPRAAKKLGMTPQELRREFNRELRRMKLRDPTASGR